MALALAAAALAAHLAAKAGLARQGFQTIRDLVPDHGAIRTALEAVSEVALGA